MSKDTDRGKKLVKVYFNSRALDKAQKVEWESPQAFTWDESEPLAESDEQIFETPDLTVLTSANSNWLTPTRTGKPLTVTGGATS